MSRRTIAIPLAADNEWATLTATWPLTEAEWQTRMALMETMQPALVLSASTENDNVQS